MYKFKFADIGEGLHEGTVGEIFVKVGDTVTEGDSLFSVETDKVTSDIPSPVSGKVLDILIKTGETVHVGDDIFHFDAPGEKQEEVKPEVKEEVKPEVKEETKPEVKKEAPAEAASVVGEVKVSNEVVKNDFAQASDTAKTSDFVLTTPLARRVAAEKGIDITRVAGKGPNGKVLLNDILSASPLGGKKIIKPVGQTQTVKDSGVRKAIAKGMKNSWNNIAYTNLVTEVNMTTLWDQRKATFATKAMVDKLGIKITFLPFIIKAVVKALEKYPQFNSKHNDEKGEMVLYSDKNIGIAVDTPHGLFVPVIKRAETKSLVEIAKEIATLAKKAKDKKLSMSDMSEGTFTISNYGTTGALHGVPIINYPELAILGTGAIVDKVLISPNGDIVKGKVMHLTTAVDHRWIDGADAGRFAWEIKTILENPILMLEEFDNV